MDGAAVSAAEIPVTRLAWATRFLVGGLLVAAISLAWQSPLSFLAFAGIGISMSAAGLAIFLWSIVDRSVPKSPGG